MPSCLTRQGRHDRRAAPFACFRLHSPGTTDPVPNVAGRDVIVDLRGGSHATDNKRGGIASRVTAMSQPRTDPNGSKPRHPLPAATGSSVERRPRPQPSSEDVLDVPVPVPDSDDTPTIISRGGPGSQAP